MSAFIFRLLLSSAALLALGLINAAGDAGAEPYPEEDARIPRQPLILFVAKGAANACGPGCSEWIAAEGLFDFDAPQRLRDFLTTLPRRDLPVFFNSDGGKVKSGMEIGRLLRDHRMTVGIGRTVPDGCRNAAATDDACRRVMQSQAEHKARLITAGARCASSCVVAFAGGSVRHAARDAQLGIHSVRAFTRAPDEAHRILKRYLVHLEVDAGLIDAAAKISADDVRYLSRDEIVRFGVETRNVYETAWLPYLERDKRPAVLKSVTQPKGASGKEYRTSSIQISCQGAGPSLWFAYRRELAPDEIGPATAIRAAAGDREFSVGDTSASSTSVDWRIVTTGGEFLAKAIAAPAIVITETFTPAGNEPAWSREIKFSTNGLAKAVEDLQKSCTPSPAVAAAADDFRTCHAASGDVAMSACTRAIARATIAQETLRLSTTCVARTGTPRPSLTAPSPTSARRSGSIRNTPGPTTTAASPGATRATSTAPSPTSPRRSGSIRNTPPPTTTAAMPGATRAISTAPSPTTPRRSGSIRNTPSPTTTAALPGAPKATSTAPSPTTTRRSGSSYPKYAPAYNNRGLAWRDKGDLDRAIADYNEAIRLDPKYAFAYNNRGFAWRAKGDLDRAIADYTEAIRLEPKNAAYYRNRGYAFSTRATSPPLTRTCARHRSRRQRLRHAVSLSRTRAARAGRCRRAFRERGSAEEQGLAVRGDRLLPRAALA